ncbi:isochorismate synthase [Scrofimicrobium sp. R131]|uniref:isochorismate synthase n=1 Tax=Scrofimicrobium appendicitidis TaxID=3079930 RepID=A0AAU7V6S0_9ACTO
MEPELFVRIERTTTTDLLSLVPSELLCWIGPDRKLVGWGEALKIEFVGNHAIRDAARRWDDLVDHCVLTDLANSELARSAPIALASFGFAAHTPGYLIVPKVLLVQEGDETLIITASTEGPAESAPELTRHEFSTPQGLWTDPGRMTQSQWLTAVRRLTNLLQAGAASKVVLTRDIVVSAATEIDERFLVQRLTELYPTTWVYAVAGLVGATPEMLAAMNGTSVVSRVLAGTSAPGQGQELLDSLKNRSEHHFAVESVARALAPRAEKLNVPTEPKLLDLPNVTHLATDVTAEIKDANVLDIVDALHPTAAVCGTPTKLAFDILEDLEGTQRGRYSGPVGWIDASGSGEFGIALRCGQIEGNSIRVFAGGGIMPDSIPEVELAETRAKMRPVLEALGLED